MLCGWQTANGARTVRKGEVGTDARVADKDVNGKFEVRNVSTPETVVMELGSSLRQSVTAHP